jgi:CheY-like chemotaxis protein
VDLAEVVADAVALTRPRWHEEAARRGVRIDLRPEMAGPLPVRGVAVDLREIVVNLILNAVDAMPSGGTLVLRGEAGEGRAVLVVQDSGMGMPSEILARVFEPFFTTKGSGGMGMGLAILREVVVRHGGEMGVESVVGSGTRFTVVLPLAAGNPAGEAARAPDGEAGGASASGQTAGGTPASGEMASGARAGGHLATGAPSGSEPLAADDAAAVLDGLAILLVDDDPVFRAVFARRLALDAGRVEVAADAAAALMALETASWDVLFVDDQLPDLTGRQLAAEVRQRGLDCAIVLVSGFATRPNDPALLGPGVDGVLPKPCSDGELARVLRQVRLSGGGPDRPAR